MKVVDALERSVDVRGRPRRIVSLVPSLTEALFAFGLDEAIVGVTRFCVEPREGVAAKTKVGGTKTPDLPRLIELEPDLVIANAEENRKEDIEALIGAGLTVFVTYPRTVAGAIEMMRQLAEMTDSRERAKPLIAEAERALAEVQSQYEEKAVKVFCPIWRNPWMTIGPDTYTHDVITVCGGRNVYHDRWDRYPRVDLSEVAYRDPAVILLPDEPYRFGERHLPELLALQSVSAVRNRRIYLMEGKHLCWYGPRIGGSLRVVAGLIHGG